MQESGFLDFLNFFAIFFGIFLPGFSMSGIRPYDFFLPFPAYLIPFRLKIMPKVVFEIFWKFCNFFRNFLNRVENERNSGLKFLSLFPGLSDPVLARNNTGMRFFNFSNFFAIVFGIFWPGSSMIGIGA